MHGLFVFDPFWVGGLFALGPSVEIRNDFGGPWGTLGDLVKVPSI